MHLDELPGEIGLLSGSRHPGNELRRRRGGQFISERKLQRLFCEVGSKRHRHPNVKVSFFFDTLRFQAKLMQLVPRLLIGITADHTKHRGPQIRQEHLRISDKFLETFPRPGDHVFGAELPEFGAGCFKPFICPDAKFREVGGVEIGKRPRYSNLGFNPRPRTYISDSQ